MQTDVRCGKLVVRKGRYVCPFCNTTMRQKASEDTQAKNLVLWCHKCKSEIKVNIQDGQCSMIASAR